MTQNPFIRVLALALFVIVGASACGSEVTVGGATQAPADAELSETRPEPAVETQAEEVPSTAGSEPTAVVEPAEAQADSAPELPASEQGTVTVSFDDGRSWTLPATDCVYDPNSALGLSITGTDEGTVEVDIFSTRALDEFTDADASQIFFASFVDENDTLYQFEDPQSFDATGGQIRLTAAVHSNLFYQIGDAPDAIATVTC